MEIKTAEFVISNTDVKKCPAPNLPEYAFIGRSNVGKSSLINMLCNNKGLAKISGRPGKTQLINHFIINDTWYLVDLPGYGYAKIAKSQREKWHKFIEEYLRTRLNLMNVFVLVDCRLEPQQIDLEFMGWLGQNGIPFSMIFTKLDKLNKSQRSKFLPAYEREMLKMWEEMPPVFISSAESAEGKEEILAYIAQINTMYSN